jgi:hypothetical protein
MADPDQTAADVIDAVENSCIANVQEQVQENSASLSVGFRASADGCRTQSRRPL